MIRNASDLDDRQRMQVAHVAGHGQRLAYGNLSDLPLDRKLAQLWEISRDPAVFGVELGAALANVELDGWEHATALVDLLRAAGADEDIAASCLQWHRGRPEYRGRR